MPRGKSADYNEKVDIAGDTDSEDSMEEEVEYEEVEEEVEEMEEAVVEDEGGEEVGEEEEEEANDAGKCAGSDEEKVQEEDEKEKHANLLALPPHGSEVYVGGIPSDTSEDELRGFCQRIGEVAEIRIMKGKVSSQNKGFSFVTFKSVELASKAIEELNDTDFKGKRVKCSTSQAKNRLFIGNVPKAWGDEDLGKVVTAVGPGVVSLKLVKDMNNMAKNRGFAFVVYHNHACAEYARQKMTDSKFKLDNNVPTVSWADSKNDDSSPSPQVKAIYVKNLPKNVTQDQFKKIFEHHGKITKVILPPAKSGHETSRIGFVHFSERSSAMKAIEATEKYEMDDRLLECSLAKPPADPKSVKASNSRKPGLLSSYPPRTGYGLAGGPYGSLGAVYGTQPMLYGRGAAPGVAMMPMLLPDGRIGYVLQQGGGAPPSEHRRSGGSLNRDGGRGRRRRYRPY